MGHEMKKCLDIMLLAFCGLLFVPCLVYAQSEGAIRGVVTAKADGSLLPNADIQVESPVLAGELRTTAGEDGHFSFQRLIPGPYTLTARHAGFEEQRLEFTLKPREVQSINVQLPLERIVQSTEVTAQGDMLGGTYAPNSTTLQTQTVA